MTLVDSSGWIEYFVDGPLADRYQAYLSDPEQVLTPTLVLHEVYKKIRRERGEEAALLAAAQMQKTRLAPLTPILALAAADVGIQHGLALADSVVYATALAHDVELVTSDADFAELPGVIYLSKR